MRLLKSAGFVVAGALALVVLGYGVVYFQTQARITKTYEVRPEPLQAVSLPGVMLASELVPAEAASYEDNGAGKGSTETAEAALAWGEHIASTRGCRDCHGEDLGGGVFADDMPVFQLMGSNLTPGGVGASYTEGDWVRSIRHGIRPDGSPLLFMPSYEYYYLSDQDLAALIAYLKSLPAVDRDPGTSRVGPMGRVLFMAGKLPILIPAEIIDHDAPRPEMPGRGATAAYGEYLASGCIGCHGPGFSGGTIPGVPPDWPQAANLTPNMDTGMGGWSHDDFIRVMREGRRPDGREIQPQFMPWTNFARFQDYELDAIWAYLQTLEPKAFGGR